MRVPLAAFCLGKKWTEGFVLDLEFLGESLRQFPGLRVIGLALQQCFLLVA